MLGDLDIARKSCHTDFAKFFLQYLDKMVEVNALCRTNIVYPIRNLFFPDLYVENYRHWNEILQLELHKNNWQKTIIEGVWNNDHIRLNNHERFISTKSKRITEWRIKINGNFEECLMSYLNFCVKIVSFSDLKKMLKITK